MLGHLLSAFARYFRWFRQQTGNHMFALAALSILTSYAEGIGIALFFPLLRGESTNDALSASLSKVLAFLHVPATPTGALPFIVLAFLLKGALLLITYAYQGRLSARIPLALRNRIIAALGGIDYRAIVTTNTGFLSNLLGNEVNKVGSGFVYFVRTFPSALNIGVFFAIVLWLDWKLTVLCALMGLCAVAVLSITGGIASRASSATVKEGATLSSLLIQMVQSFKYLRATAGFGSFQDRIGGAAERLSAAEYRNSAAAAISVSIAQPLMGVFLAALLYYRSSVQGEPIGALFVLLLYFFRIMTELWAMQFNWQTFIGYCGPMDLVQSSLAEYEARREHNGAQPFTGLQREIAIDKLSFEYTPDKPVLSEISLTIPKNSTIAFVGESGSGKSTLVDLVLGTLKPTQGAIKLDGVSLAEMDLGQLRRRVGYVPQDAMLFDDTVGNNISLWAEKTEARLLDAATRAKCLEFIQAMPGKFEEHIGDRGVRLSGGQRQRLAIARELYKQPDILVLDEATSALDSESERAIQQSIDSLKGAMTILIIAHRLSTIRNCDLVCVLKDGHIVEQGSYDALLANPTSLFRRMCDLQQLMQDRASA